MKGIIESTHVVGPEDPLVNDPRVRELQVLAAYLRDSCSSVNVDNVTKIANARLDELFQTNQEKLKALDLAADFILRSAKSIL